MLEEILFNFLNNVELDAPTYTMIPKNPPEEFYVLERTGGGISDHINSTTVAIRSNAQSLERAADLMYDLDNVMRNALPSLDYICGVRRNSIANFTDPQTKAYRYQGVYVISHY